MFAAGIVYFDMFKDGLKRAHAPLLAVTQDALLVAVIGQDFFDLDLYERSTVAPGDALALGLGAGARAIVSDGSLELALPVETSMAVPHGGAWIEAGHAETALLAPSGAPLTVRKA